MPTRRRAFPHAGLRRRHHGHAELLIEHQVDVGEELDRDAVRIFVIDRNVVPDEVADRAPEQLDVLARQEVARAVDLLGFVAQLEREVVLMLSACSRLRLVPFGSVNTIACAIPGVMPLRRSDLIPAFDSRADR
jgi:hypothetical protein